jgi:predicted MPP superfamily phosphohydrolase
MGAGETMREFDIEKYVRRLGRFHVEQRLNIQAHHAADILGPGLIHIHIENMLWLHFFIKRLLQVTGFYGRGRRNSARFAIHHNEVVLPNLPAPLDGLTLLHLTDLHADFSTDAMSALAYAVRDVQWDACVWTGDYRGLTHGPWEPAAANLRRVREALRGPVYAVLGNHDPLELGDALEDMDVHLLLNERAAIERGGARLWIAGVDDVHIYETDNIEKAVDGIPDGELVVLLSHSPELYRKAAYGGIDLMLSGHTHGGQLCLPGGWPIIANARVPWRMVSGAWRYHQLQGYTSAGCGVSGVDCRYNCPPEIVLHHLRRAPVQP